VVVDVLEAVAHQLELALQLLDGRPLRELDGLGPRVRETSVGKEEEELRMVGRDIINIDGEINMKSLFAVVEPFSLLSESSAEEPLLFRSKHAKTQRANESGRDRERAMNVFKRGVRD
jgi:hypothetical protein